jgi:F-type H+-transporting ATPase subunit delta
MLRAASAGAQTALAEKLAQVSSDTATVGEQLLGVASLLRGEASLRRVVTDASIEGDAKAGLVGNVFGDAVGEATLDLIQDAVRRRWTAARDLADVLERLGVVALVRSAGDEGSQISDELFAVRQLVDGNDDLRSALSDPARSVADRGALLGRLLESKVQPATLLLVSQALSGAHGAVDGALDDFQHLAAEARDELLATVVTARSLEDDERDRLVQALSRQYDTAVHLQVVVDPDVVGGLRVEIGDDVIDGTVSGRLEDAQRKLVG